MRLVRQITTVGNSVGVTLPRELLDAYGLQKGALVEARAIGLGPAAAGVRSDSAKDK